MNNPWFSKIAVWLIVIVVLFTAFKQFERSEVPPVSYNQFTKEMQDGKLERVEIQNNKLQVTPKSGLPYSIMVPNTSDDDLLNALIKYNVRVDGKGPEQQSLLMTLLVSWGPLILLIGVWIYFMRQMQGGGKGGAFSFGKSKAKMLDESTNQITFADVAGCDEAKEEVAELVDFLREPQKFQRLGGRIPRGVMLVGPPGTGKTLLAKAIAGEAKVPFFSISGSDFVEMFVGVGASRVRDMFEQAKKNAPCIIFIDEIDAVGRQRGAGMGGGNDEREQTLNQMLVEMDGFETNQGVIVIAATNRPDILDKALLRPGRFDRQVHVTLPDVKGREQILNVHMRKVPLAPDVKADILAKATTGFSGADLANLVNEAALMAARHNARTVTMNDFEQAREKITLGPARTSAVITKEELLGTAYHEAGHALVAYLIPKGPKFYKVTIIPRGRTLGVTWFLPENENGTRDKEQMLAQMSTAFGGRIAEEIFMNMMSTGASQDFQQATQLSRAMVTVFGMSDLGPMVYDSMGEEMNFGRSALKTSNVSEATMQKVDEEVRRLIDQQYVVARKLIEENKEKMDAIANALMEYETLDMDQFDDIMAGKPPRPPSDEAFKDVKRNTPPSQDGNNGATTENSENTTPPSDQKPDDTPQAV